VFSTKNVDAFGNFALYAGDYVLALLFKGNKLSGPNCFNLGESIVGRSFDDVLPMFIEVTPEELECIMCDWQTRISPDGGECFSKWRSVATLSV